MGPRCNVHIRDTLRNPRPWVLCTCARVSGRCLVVGTCGPTCGQTCGPWQCPRSIGSDPGPDAQVNQLRCHVRVGCTCMPSVVGRIHAFTAQMPLTSFLWDANSSAYRGGCLGPRPSSCCVPRPLPPRRMCLVVHAYGGGWWLVSCAMALCMAGAPAQARPRPRPALPVGRGCCGMQT